jgi:hypothetical protein
MMPIDEAASVPHIRYRQKFGMSVREHVWQRPPAELEFRPAGGEGL